MENLLNVQQVAALFNIHIKKAQRLARTGVLPCFKIGAVYRFQPAALDAWISSKAQSAGPVPKVQPTSRHTARRSVKRRA